jgi:hypothetical protein
VAARRADPGRCRAADHHFGIGDSDYPLAATWWSLLLAIAPAPVAAAAAFAPAPVNRLAAVIGVVVLVAGIAGGLLHTGLLFAPALVVLVVGTVKLWREQSRALAGG